MSPDAANAAPPIYRVTELGDLPGGTQSGIALDLNLLGRVVGQSGGVPTSLSTRFEGGAVVELGMPGGVSPFPTGSRANGVNESGLMVGQGAIGSGSAVRPLLWLANGSVSDIGVLYPLQQDLGQANAINNPGSIVGWTGITGSIRVTRFRRRRRSARRTTSMRPDRSSAWP